jgi:hypothetical protein
VAEREVDGLDIDLQLHQVADALVVARARRRSSAGQMLASSSWRRAANFAETAAASSLMV